MADRRRLSESISEGDGISILVDVGPHAEALSTIAGDAVGLLVPPGGVPADDVLPVAVRGGTPAEAGASGADGWLLVAGEGEDALVERYGEAGAIGLECVVEIRDEDELERVLAELDPEIVLLSPDHEELDGVARVLELLSDLPAGKLAIAALAAPTSEDLAALERAGVDAALIDLEHVATLFGS